MCSGESDDSRHLVGDVEVEEFLWRCSMFGCMWWLHMTVDRVRGSRSVHVRRYRTPPAVPEGRLF